LIGPADRLTTSIIGGLIGREVTVPTALTDLVDDVRKLFSDDPNVSPPEAGAPIPPRHPGKAMHGQKPHPRVGSPLSKGGQREKWESDTLFRYVEDLTDYDTAKRLISEPDDLRQFVESIEMVPSLRTWTDNFKKGANQIVLAHLNHVRGMLGRPNFVFHRLKT
jgi:hypothetical protein